MQMNVKLIVCLNILFAGRVKKKKRNNYIQDKHSCQNEQDRHGTDGKRREK